MTPKSLKTILEEFESIFSTPELYMLKEALQSYALWVIENNKGSIDSVVKQAVNEYHDMWHLDAVVDRIVHKALADYENNLRKLNG